MKGKVLLVVPVFPQPSETFIVNHFSGLLEKGWNVHLLCGRINRSAISHYQEVYPKFHGRIHTLLPVHPAVLAFFLFPFILLFSLCFSPGLMVRYFRFSPAKSIWEKVKQFYLDFPVLWLNPDILHFEFGYQVVGKSFLKSVLNCRLVVSFRGHDLDFWNLDAPDAYRVDCSRVDAIHVLSEALRQKALQRGCPENSVFWRIPPAVNPADFKPNGTRKNAEFFNILSVGRLHWVKGYEYALSAIAILKQQQIPVRYCIIGDGEFRPALEFAVHQLGLQDCVTFLGKQSQDVIRRELEKADVFLHPAVEEGFGNAVLEAQAMEVPVVCSDAVGLPENVQDGVTGFVVPRRNPQLLAEKLIFLLQNPQARIEIGRAGRQRVLECFSLEQQKEAFDRMYSSLFTG
ncbi:MULTISPECIES: glycosyltransferase family 4 protein [Anaerolinea]|uniref:Glycosyltransferase n=1 Tax=Anaerolinea thermophila (strain DSM 14523 / JCM 11388 / NBRC 100420 / UNI-1) TaxID=926569 RepID=E8N092_ANATU|nr:MULTISPECIES: glycosyltransferase family 4 protein [Anaerolinea]BAJ64641.1 putative glycosyltransferase [Anaerolinea thermophila UNI-1]